MTVGTFEGQRGPGKQVIALAIVFCALIVSVLLFKSTNGGPASTDTKKTPVRTTIAEIDTDNDGVKDWEEALFGTNPRNPDSDGDGTGDKAEQEAILAEEARRREESLAMGKSISQEDSPDWGSLSYEDKVARMLLANYFTYKQAGVSFTDSNIGALVDTLPQYTFTNEIDPYTLDDMTTTDDNSTGSIKLYGNTVGSILTNTGSNAHGGLSAAYAFAAFSETGNRTQLASDIQPIIAEYASVKDDLARVVVPTMVAGIHVDILNALGTLVRDLEGIAMIEESAVTTLAAFGTYQEDSAKLAGAFDRLQQYFQDAGVLFDEDESGFVLTQ